MFKKLWKWVVRFVKEREEERKWRENPFEMLDPKLKKEIVEWEKEIVKEFDERRNG